MPNLPPSFNNCKFLSKNNVDTFPSSNILSLPLESTFLANSYCDSFSLPVTFISFPNGGLLNEIENESSLIFCLVNSFHLLGSSKLSSQNIPPFPSPSMAMYDLLNFAKKLSFSIPLIFLIPSVFFSSEIAPSDQPYIFPSSSTFCHSFFNDSTRKLPLPQLGSIIMSSTPGLIAATSIFTTFFGVKNCPCSPFNELPINTSNASAIVSLSVSITLKFCILPMMYLRVCPSKSIKSPSVTTSLYFLFTFINNVSILFFTSLSVSSSATLNSTISSILVKRSSYILHNIKCIISFAITSSLLTPTLFPAI